MKMLTYRKNAFSKVFCTFRDIDKTQCMKSSISHQAFNIYAYNSVPSVEIIKNIEDYHSKNGTKRKMVKMGNFLLDYLPLKGLESNYGCNRIKGSFG